MDADNDKFETPEEVAASLTHNSTTEASSDASPLERCELFPNTPLATQPAASRVTQNNNGEMPSPRPAENPAQLLLHL